MTLTERLRERTALVRPPAAARTRMDVVFLVAVSLLLAVHLVIFAAVFALAPVSTAEQRALDLVQLPVEVARALVLPFHALLLGCLYVLGRRVAGRWAGFGSMLAVLALDLVADPARPVYGPPTAEGGWVAAALLAAALVLLPRHRLVAAALLGVASGGAAVLLLALPAFLAAILLTERRPAGRDLLGFAGAFAAPAAAMQLIWLASLGADGWLARAGEYLALLGPHPVVPFLEQQRLLFAAWHFAPLTTFTLAMFLFTATGIGVVRWFLEPVPGEAGRVVPRVARRFPIEFWAAALVMIATGAFWAASGQTVIVDPNLPVLAAIAPLLTAMAYRGAKWLLTVNRFWALCAVLYLIGLILARSTQLVITLVHALLL